MWDLLDQEGIRINPNCGCLEEHYSVGMIDVVIHLEPNGSGEAFLNAGDWEEELTWKKCHTLEILKEKVAKYIESLPIQD